MKFLTVQEAEASLAGLDDPEAIKHAAVMLAPADAFCELFRHSLRDQILATRSNELAEQTVRLGHKVVEKSLERRARASEEYKQAQQLYQEALELKIYLKTYLAGVKMSHEATIAQQRRDTAEIKAGIYHKGS